jgi:hypothetical protein
MTSLSEGRVISKMGFNVLVKENDGYQTVSYVNNLYNNNYYLMTTNLFNKK